MRSRQTLQERDCRFGAFLARESGAGVRNSPTMGKRLWGVGGGEKHGATNDTARFWEVRFTRDLLLGAVGRFTRAQFWGSGSFNSLPYGDSDRSGGRWFSSARCDRVRHAATPLAWWNIMRHRRLSVALTGNEGPVVRAARRPVGCDGRETVDGLANDLVDMRG